MNQENKTPKEDDLVLGSGESEETEYELEFTPLETYVNCACAAIGAIEGYNALTQEDTEIKERILSKSLALLDYAITELHKEIAAS